MSNTFPSIASFEPLSPEICCDASTVMNWMGAVLAKWTLVSFFSYPVESSSLSSRAGLSTVSENSGLSRRRYQDGGSDLD